MTDIRREFYEKNYDTIGHWRLEPGHKVILGDPQNRKCRFCGKAKPDVTFDNVAHAIPELLGNRSIISAWECDTCNHFFGTTIDNDLGNWSKPQRTFSRIRGKNGVPTLKKEADTGWRIEHDNEAGLQIHEFEDDPVCDLDEASQTITFRLKRDPYTPVAVLKSIMKMGLTLMPEEEIHNFRHVLAWIRHPDHATPFAEYLPILYSYQPGAMPSDLIHAWILRRKPDVTGVCYALFVLLYGNEMFQLMLPSKEMDGANIGSIMCYFPMPSGLVDPKYGPPISFQKHLEGREKIKGEMVNVTCHFTRDAGRDSNSERFRFSRWRYASFDR